jgi:adenosine deaminase
MSTLHELVRQMPKVELHVHLEWSVAPRTLLALAARNHITLPANTVEGLQAWYKFTNFAHFVDIYKTISRCIRTVADIELITREFLAGQAAQNILYTEATYTAYTHFQQKGIPFAEQLAAINRARTWARDTLQVDMGLIIDIDRGLSSNEGMITARWAVEGMADGVVALGLGGAEVGNPPEKFANAFRFAREAGLRSIPHAGETAGAKSIWGALRVLGAERIGHGVHCLEDPALVDELRSRRITLEVCPTSNVCLGVASNWALHPLPKLIDAGLCVTLNSDDPPMFNTTLTQEFEHCVSVFGFTFSQLEALTNNAVNAACLAEAHRDALAGRIASQMPALRQQLAESPPPAYKTVLRTGAYETIQLTPTLYLNRWFRTPTAAEGSRFVNDLKALLDRVPAPISFISDLRRGAIKDIDVINKLAQLPQHPNWAHATAFGSIASGIYAGIYERLSRKEDYSEETWSSFEKALHYLEQQQPGLTHGIDWRSVLNLPMK